MSLSLTGGVLGTEDSMELFSECVVVTLAGSSNAWDKGWIFSMKIRAEKRRFDPKIADKCRLCPSVSQLFSGYTNGYKQNIHPCLWLVSVGLFCLLIGRDIGPGPLIGRGFCCGWAAAGLGQVGPGKFRGWSCRGWLCWWCLKRDKRYKIEELGWFVFLPVNS